MMKSDRQHYEDELSFSELIRGLKSSFRYLITKWPILVLVGILGGSAGLVYSYFSKPSYISQTTFVLEEDSPGGGMLGQLGGLAGLAGIDVGGGGGLFQGDNIIKLYESRSMIQKTLLSEVDRKGGKLLLIDAYLDFNKIRDSWKDDPQLRNINFRKKDGKDFSRLQDSIISLVVLDINKNYLSVSKPDKKLSIISVEVKSENEFFAEAFNNQIVKNVNEFYIQTKTMKSLENLEILQHQTDSVRNVLNGAIYTTAAIFDRTPNLNSARQSLRVPAQKSQFNAEANKAILTQLVQNLELAKLAYRKETPLIQIIDQPVLPLPINKVSKVIALVMGGILAGIICVIYLLATRRSNPSIKV